jgi:hypothetical protein
MGGSSENPHALHVSPHDKVKVWHTEWAQNQINLMEATPLCDNIEVYIYIYV